MSINFNKLFIQDLMSRRGSSHPHDFPADAGWEDMDQGVSEESLTNYDDESSVEYNAVGNDQGDIRTHSLQHLPSSQSLLAPRHSASLIAAIGKLQMTIRRQVELQEILSQCRTTNRGSTDLSSSAGRETLPGAGSNESKPEKIEIKILPNTFVAADEQASGQPEKAQGRQHNAHPPSEDRLKRRRKRAQHYSARSAPNAVYDDEPLSFRRCERLSKRGIQTAVEVRVVFLKIGEIDTLKEIYHADVFIQIKWREPRLDGKTDEELRKIDLYRCWNPLIIIDNILTETRDQHWIVTSKNDKDQVFLYERRRLRAVFLETLELNDFPLDVQDLTITLTSERPESEVELIPDKKDLCGINLQTLVDQQEWRLHEHIEITRRSATQEYTNSSQSHAFISVTCRAARRPGYFYWNVFLIMFFITGLSFATFAVPAERPENRLQLSFTLFLTSVAFKFVINQSLPKISYLTYMDKYVLMSLAILCVVSIWHALVTLMPTDTEFNRIMDLKFSNLTVNDPTLPASLADALDNATFPDNYANHTAYNATTNRFDIKSWSLKNWQNIATRKATMQYDHKVLMKRIEKDVFASFFVLYILAHCTFIFWLYFDASKRRREMVELDRIYKKKLQASKSTHNEKC